MTAKNNFRMSGIVILLVGLFSVISLSGCQINKTGQAISGTNPDSNISCASYACGDWGPCDLNCAGVNCEQERVCSASPDGCNDNLADSAQSPAVTQTCIRSFDCADWSCSGFDSSDCVDGVKTQTCIAIPSGCSGTPPAAEPSLTEPCTSAAITCTDACTSGAVQCLGNGVQTCTKTASGCTEWSAAVACVSAQSCVSGVCVSPQPTCLVDSTCTTWAACKNGKQACTGVKQACGGDLTAILADVAAKDCEIPSVPQLPSVACSFTDCGEWSICDAGTQSRLCKDIAGCGQAANKETRSCSAPCTDWSCGLGDCSDGFRRYSCTPTPLGCTGTPTKPEPMSPALAVSCVACGGKICADGEVCRLNTCITLGKSNILIGAHAQNIRARPQEYTIVVGRSAPASVINSVVELVGKFKIKNIAYDDVTLAKDASLSTTNYIVMGDECQNKVTSKILDKSCDLAVQRCLKDKSVEYGTISQISWNQVNHIVISSSSPQMIRKGILAVGKSGSYTEDLKSSSVTFCGDSKKKNDLKFICTPVVESAIACGVSP